MSENVFLDKIRIEFDEENIDTQQEYFEILDKLIDAVILLKYEEQKSNLFRFNFANEINDFLLSYFDKINEENRDKILIFIIKQFEALDEDTALDTMINLYKIYLQNNKSLPQKDTSKFYNFILGRQQNSYFSREKSKMTKLLKNILPISKKKEASLLVATKRKIIIQKIQEDKLEEIGLCKDNIRNTLLWMHELSDDQLPFNTVSKKDLEICDKLFLKGFLDEEHIKEMCPNLPIKTIKKILGKYNKQILDYTKNINIDYKINPKLIEYNYNHLQIISYKKYNTSLNHLNELLTDKEKEYILKYFDDLKDILKLLPFTNISILQDYFNIDILKSILLNYNEIKKNLMSQTNNSLDITFNFILNHLKKVLLLAKIYEQTNSMAIAIVKEENMKKIILNNRRTSCEPNTYIEVYKKMLGEKYTEIPPIFFYYRMKGTVYKIESGNNYDVDRLLIGKNCYNSCISPLGSGEKAYMECLTKRSGDVILIKNALTEEFYARILTFRRGNTLVLANIVDNKKINQKFYNHDFLYTLGNMFLEKARKVGDNLHYIVMSKGRELEGENYFRDKLLQLSINHCDMSEYFRLIASDRKELDIDINTNTLPLYYKTRKKVIKKSTDYIEDVKRLDALLAIYYKDFEIFDSLRKKFFHEEHDYKTVYIGQDFYIAVLKNGAKKCIQLPINDERMREEICMCIAEIVEEENRRKEISTYLRKKTFSKKR